MCAIKRTGFVPCHFVRGDIHVPYFFLSDSLVHQYLFVHSSVRPSHCPSIRLSFVCYIVRTNVRTYLPTYLPTYLRTYLCT